MRTHKCMCTPRGEYSNKHILQCQLHRSPCIYLSTLAYKTPVSCSFHPPHNMYICTHASTPGTTAWQRLREKLMQLPGALHVSFSSTQASTFSNPNTRTSMYPLPENPIPLNSPASVPNKPRNSSRNASKRSFTVPKLISIQSAQL